MEDEMTKARLLIVWCLALSFVSIDISEAAEARQPSMRLTTDTPETMPLGRAAAWFGQEIERRLPTSEVKIFNSSALYDNTDSLEAMHAGTLEACWATSSKIAGIIPEVLCLRIPSLFSDYSQVQKIPETKIGQYITKACEKKGFIPLSWGNLSPYIGVASKSRILSPSEWDGKKIRIYEKEVQRIMVRELGGNPIVMPWGEFVPSVQSGVVDAGFTSLSSWEKVKETLPFFTSIGMVPDYYIFLVAKHWWNKLDDPTRRIVSEVAKEAAAKQMQWQYEKDQADTKALGTDDPSQPGFYLLSPDQLKPYIEKWATPTRKIVRQKIGKSGDEILNQIIELSRKP
jgi:TRAP-type C4-dicarboxylate transport system substrate-binding protein